MLDTGFGDLPFIKKKNEEATQPEQAETGQGTAVQDEPATVLVPINPKEEKEGVTQDENFETVDYDLAAAHLTRTPPQEASAALLCFHIEI